MNSDQIKIRDYRPYKKLSLAQRIQVIKAYKNLQNYQKLSKLFNCSTMQIKCIIACQEELLERYESYRSQNINNCAEPNSHEEKMNLLGKVVFEYLLRAMNSRMPTNTTVIRQKALEVKEALGIEDFKPDEQWLHAFKVNSNRVDLMDLMEKLEKNIEYRRSLDCNDIIEYIREQDREERLKLMADDEKLSKEIFQATKEESFKNENRNNVGNTSGTVSKQKTVVGERNIRKTRVKLNTAAKRNVQDCNNTCIIENIREQARKERRELTTEDECIARLSPAFEKLSRERVEAKKEESFRKENRYNKGNAPASMPKRRKVVEETDIRKTRVKLKAAARRCAQEHTEVNIKSEMEDELEVKQENEFSDGNQELTSGDSKIFKIIKVESINTTANKNSTSPEIPSTLSAPRGGISSYAVALRHLRKLENFAMNQEDYEALSVITHLEYIFRNSK